MNNVEVRVAIKRSGLKQWQIAEEYGLHEGNFSRLLRKPLSEQETEKIMTAIRDLKDRDVLYSSTPSTS